MFVKNKWFQELLPVKHVGICCRFAAKTAAVMFVKNKWFQELLPVKHVGIFSGYT